TDGLYVTPYIMMFIHVRLNIDAIVTITEPIRSILTAIWVAPLDKSSVVPMFADIPLDLRHESNDQGKVIILTFVRLVKKKANLKQLREIWRLRKNNKAC